MQQPLATNYTARNVQVAASLLQACCKLRSSSRYQDAFASLAPGLDDNKSAASCQQACCKLRTADLLQIANGRLAASCKLQTCCKLRTAGLLQVVEIRLTYHIDKTIRKTQEIHELLYFIRLTVYTRIHLSFITLTLIM